MSKKSPSVLPGVVGVGAGAAKFVNDVLPTTDTVMKDTWVKDLGSDVGNHILTKVPTEVTIPGHPVHEALRNAADFGVKVAGGVAIASAAIAGAKAVKKHWLSRQFDKYNK